MAERDARTVQEFAEQITLHITTVTEDRAGEWLIQGVPLTTVQAWLGHGSIQITARYLHHLGDFADRAALDVLNSAASKALSERAKKLPGLGRFGTTGRAGSRPITRAA